jgi:hypothetical protein
MPTRKPGYTQRPRYGSSRPERHVSQGVEEACHGETWGLATRIAALESREALLRRLAGSPHQRFNEAKQP